MHDTQKEYCNFRKDMIGLERVSYFLTPRLNEKPFLEVDFNIKKEEYRGLIFKFTHSYDYGMYRIFLDGKNMQQLEGYLWHTK